MKLSPFQHSLLLLLAILLQLVFLAGEYAHSRYPLLAGERVKLSLRPYDPRSYFRGQYVRLNYEISSLPVSLFRDRPKGTLPAGRPLYVVLRRGDDDVWHAESINLRPPKGETFIRGRLEHSLSSYTSTASLRYGIEAYFTSPHRASKLERESGRRGSFAEVALLSNGRAALVEITGPEKEPLSVARRAP